MISRILSLIGVLGTGVCAVAMFAVSLGLVGASATVSAKASRTMDSMSSVGSMAATPAWLSGLLRFGPEILVASLLLVIVPLALRRSIGTLPAVVGGTILFAGMYVQSNGTIMVIATGLGFSLIVTALLFGNRKSAARRSNTSTIAT